jgi:uncharacterized protein (DUF697 family)/uncharacterized tellurite resistance protein B-like protein
MANINQDELTACFQLLVQMVKADGQVAPAELASLEETMALVGLGEYVSLPELLRTDMDTSALLARISSETARKLVYQSAHTMAYIDGECSPEEEKLLNTMSEAFTKDMVLGKQIWLAELERKARTGNPSIATTFQQVADPIQRRNEVDKQITDMCFINGVLGAFPLAGFSIAFDLLVYANQVDLCQSIGEIWGYKRSRQELRKALFNTIGLTGARIALCNVCKLIPPVGMVVGATTSFASTWAIGKVAEQYFANGCQLDDQTIKQAFQKANQEGKEKFKEREAEITARSERVSPQVASLNQQLAEGIISQAEYQAKLQELLV